MPGSFTPSSSWAQPQDADKLLSCGLKFEGVEDFDWENFLAFSLRNRMVELLGTKPDMQMDVENIILASGECTE